VQVRVPVAGGTLWAEDTGGDRTPLVLIHADWTDSGIWDPVIPLLRDRYRVIRYDLHGFGRSSRPVQPFTRLDDLQALLDHFGIEEAVAVGHSGGGGTALGLAVHHPDRVRALTLIAPGIHDYPWPADDPFFGECSPLIAVQDRDSLVRLGLRTWAPAGTDDAITAMMRRAVSSKLGNCGEVLVPGADHLLPLRDPLRLAQAISEIAASPRSSTSINRTVHRK
jgi:pimeloyl-ACP methyl ester carboxylesterase